MQRPYFKFTAQRLDAVIGQKNVSKPEVMAVLAELEFRRESPLNIATKDKCIAWLKQEKTADTPKAKSSEKLNAVSLNAKNLTPVELKSTFSDLEPIDFRTPWWGVFFGGSKVTVKSINSSICLNYKNQNLWLHQPLSEHFSFEINKAAVGYKLTVQSNEGKLQCRLLGIQKFQVEQYLQSLSYEPEANRLARQYQQMLESDAYLNNRLFTHWLEDAETLVNKFPLLTSLNDVWVCHLSKLIQTHNEQRRTHNHSYIERKKDEFSNFFLKVEKSPLTDRQIEAILTDDDAVLVNAGAGTGKTSTVVGKIGFLIESGAVKPSEILALAYGKDAAKELRERVKTRLGVEVEVRTFHSLGLELIQQALGHRIEISDEASDGRAFLALVAHLLQDLWQEPEGKKSIQAFVSTHRYPAKFLEDFDSKKDYLEYLRKIEPRTLRGEPVKSFEELLIADWLLTNGIAYEYERPYEVDISSKKRRQYRPDFYLSDYGIYLEHFGIGRNGETAPHIDAKAYGEQIQWKRELHKKNGSILLETYSWQRKSGVLFSALEEQLKKHSVQLDPTGGEQVQKLIQAGELNKKLVSLLKDFLVAFKENQYDLHEIRKKLEQLTQSDRSRAKAFLNIFEEIYSKYQAHLAKRKQFDFSDCISESTKALQDKRISTKFKRVIVDEYQDISNGRFNFLKQILDQDVDCRLMAVGDDWQSIYGFTGSDVEKSTKFDKFFLGAEVVPLDQTFRFTKPIIAVSSDFVQRNPEQLRKVVRGKDSTVKRAVHVISAKDQSSVDIEAILQDIESEVPKGKKWSVFLLGRYKFLSPAPKELNRLSAAFPRLDIEFSSIHASKGREADAVVLIELVGGRYGFPGSIETDPLMNLVISGEDAYPDAEERRVLYVALTRARSKVVISARTDIPSSFLSELLSHDQVISNAPTIGSYSCSACSGRLLLRFPNRLKGYAWQCEHQPYCDGEALMCEVCLAAPKLSQSGCPNESCKSNKKLAKK